MLYHTDHPWAHLEACKCQSNLVLYTKNPTNAGSYLCHKTSASHHHFGAPPVLRPFWVGYNIPVMSNEVCSICPGYTSRLRYRLYSTGSCRLLCF